MLPDTREECLASSWGLLEGNHVNLWFFPLPDARIAARKNAFPDSSISVTGQWTEYKTPQRDLQQGLSPGKTGNEALAQLVEDVKPARARVMLLF